MLGVDKHRVFAIVFCTLLIMFCGWAMTDAIQTKCKTQWECTLLGFLAVGAVLGAIIWMATYVRHRKAQGTWKQPRKTDNGGPLPWSHYWWRAIGRLTLSTILLALPVIYEGAFLVTFGGAFVGVSIVLLFLAITDQLPDREQSEDVN